MSFRIVPHLQCMVDIFCENCGQFVVVLDGNEMYMSIYGTLFVKGLHKPDGTAPKTGEAIHHCINPTYDSE